MRGRSNKFRRDERANGAVLSITVAVSLFALSFGALTLVLTNTVNDAHEHAAGDLQGRARNTFDVLVGTAGAPHDWYDRPDTEITIVGLLKQGTTSTLDARKFLELRTERSGQAWYENELKPRLDLKEENFHLRSYPVFRVERDGSVDGLRDYRLGYVGDYEFLSPRTVGAGRDVGLLMDVNDSFTPFPNHLFPYGPGVEGGDVFSDETQRNLTASLAPRLAGFLQATDQNGGHPHDSFWRVINLTATGIPFWDNTTHVLTSNKHLGNGDKWTSAGPGLDRIIIGKVNLTSYPVPEAVSFNFSLYGKFVSTSNTFTHARIMAYCATCDLPAWDTRAIIAAGNATKWNEISLGLKDYAGEEVYLAFDWEIELTVDDLLNGNKTRVSENYWFLKDFTVDVLNNGEYTRVYENRLDYSRTNYDALMLGDGLNHAAFNDEPYNHTLRNAIHEWVQRGGDIVAFGSGELDATWMSPTLMPIGGSTSNSGLYLEGSDLTHPFLTTPHKLDYQSYAEPRATSYPVPQSSVYTTILAGKGADNPSVLAVSNPNPSFNGNLVLTSWNLTNFGERDAFRFLVNALAFARYNPLYLDYGAQMPAHPNIVASDTRLLLLDTGDPDLKVMETQVVFYMWR